MIIDQKTNIPLFAALVSIPTFFGFVLWLSSIAFDAHSAQAKIKDLELKQENYNNLLVSIKEDLTLVKYKLDINKGVNNGSSK